MLTPTVLCVKLARIQGVRVYMKSCKGLSLVVSLVSIVSETGWAMEMRQHSALGTVESAGSIAQGTPKEANPGPSDLDFPPLNLEHKTPFRIKASFGPSAHFRSYSKALTSPQVASTVCENPVPFEKQRLFDLAVKTGNQKILVELLEKFPQLLNRHCCYKKRAPLSLAVSHFHADLIPFFLNRGVSIHELDAKDLAAIHWAVAARRKRDGKDVPFSEVCALIDALLEAGADIEQPDGRYGDRPIHHAAHLGDLPMVEFLLEKKAKMDARNKEGNTPLHKAAMMGHTDMVKFFVNSEMQVETTNHVGRNAFHMAANYSDSERNDQRIETMKYLLPLMKSIDLMDKKNFTALSLSIINKNLKTFEYLLLNKANPKVLNKSGQSILHLAASTGHLEITKRAIELDLAQDAEDDAGNSPLILALLAKEFAVASHHLIHKNAPINKQNHLGSTPLHIASLEGNLETASLLLFNGADPNIKSSKDSDEMTPLHLAALKGHFPIVKLLVEGKADIESKTSLGSTALHLASLNGHESVVKYLVDKNAEVDVPHDKGQTPLMVASSKGQLSVVRFLLSKKANVNLSNKYGNTSLHEAVRGSHWSVVEELILAGAHADKENNNEQSPGDLASNDGKKMISAFLEKKKQLSAKK